MKELLKTLELLHNDKDINDIAYLTLLVVIANIMKGGKDNER